MKIAAVICARMGSTRFPGKATALLAGMPMVALIRMRCGWITIYNEIVLAIPDTAENDCLADMFPDDNVYRGSETDVLSRMIGAAESVGADYIYRITADNPIVDPVVMLEVLDAVHDYTTVVGLPQGLQPEFMSVDALKRLSEIADTPYFREHPTQGFYKWQDRFKLNLIENDTILLWPRNRDYRLTVDTPEDHDMMSKVFKALGLFATLDEVIHFLDKNPEIARMNATVHQEARIGDIGTVPPHREG